MLLPSGPFGYSLALMVSDTVYSLKDLKLFSLSSFSSLPRILISVISFIGNVNEIVG